MLNPKLDGIDHINIYSKGATELGRLLSNFAHTPFICEDGEFQSVEGYWYWLAVPEEYRETLRNLCGYEAKSFGKKHREIDWVESDIFKSKILSALDCKLSQHKDIQTLLSDSHLPFKHYYIFGDKVYLEPNKSKWILEFWEQKRLWMKKID